MVQADWPWILQPRSTENSDVTYKKELFFSHVLALNMTCSVV